MRKCVCGILLNENGEMLIQKHKKVDAYTLPGGKCDEKEYEKYTLVREMYEELGILVYRYDSVFTDEFYNCEYPVGSGNMMDFHHTYFKIEKYEGEIINQEPEKHPELIWVKPEKIRYLGNLSMCLDRYLKSLNL